MNKPEFYRASDYAGLKFKGGAFYYGYEVTNGGDDEWCFSAKFGGTEIIIPFSKLETKDMFDVVDCLNTGIGWILAKYKLTL